MGGRGEHNHVQLFPFKFLLPTPLENLRGTFVTLMRHFGVLALPRIWSGYGLDFQTRSAVGVLLMLALADGHGGRNKTVACISEGARSSAQVT